MITCVTYKNWDEFGALLSGQFKLRHAEFIDRQGYDVSTFKGMEYDQYDTPAASYLVYHTDEGGVLGVSRLTPTTQGCMLNDLWPDLVNNKADLNNPHIWEGTRYCINKQVAPELRHKIINEMAVAYLECGLELGLRKIIGMMPTYIYRSVFEKPGIEMEYLGDIQMIGRHRIRAVAILVQEQQLQRVRDKTGITNSILRYSSKSEDFMYGKAA